MSSRDDANDEDAKRRADDVDALRESELVDPVELPVADDRNDAPDEPEEELVGEPVADGGDFASDSEVGVDLDPGLADVSDTSSAAPREAPFAPFLASDIPLGVSGLGSLGDGALPVVPLLGLFETFSVDASAAQPGNLFAPANTFAGQGPAGTVDRFADIQAFLRTDRASIDATASNDLPLPGSVDPSGAPPRVFEAAPPLGTPPPPPDFLNGGSGSLGMMRPHVIVSLDKRVELVHAALDAQADRLEANGKRIANQEIDHHDWVLYTQERAIYGDY
jgi:hypothetical protein